MLFAIFAMGMYTSAVRKRSLLSVVAVLVAPGEAYVNWLYPPSSSSNALAYNYNDVVYFTWDSNFTDPLISLYCATNNEYYSRECSPHPDVQLTFVTDPGKISIQSQRHGQRHRPAIVPLRR